MTKLKAHSSTDFKKTAGTCHSLPHSKYIQDPMIREHFCTNEVVVPVTPTAKISPR